MDIWRSGAKILSVHPDNGDKLVRKVMGENQITLSFDLSAPFTFALGDYILFKGEKFKLNVTPKFKRVAQNRIEYTLLFEGLEYDLRKSQHFYYTANLDFVGGGDFSLMGNAELHLRVVVENLNRVQSGWSVGVFPTTEAKNLTFSSNNCLEALTSIVNEFETEYWIGADKTVNIGKKGSILSLTFEYGKGKGLYEIERDNVNSKDIVTRLYPFGSQNNLPKGYRSNSKRLKIASSYIENNVPIYGVIETTETFEDIKPERTGTITGVDSGNVLKFSDSSMDFDLNAAVDGVTTYLIPGTSAKIHFQDGDLAGYEFELTAYDHATKTFTLKLFTDEQAYDLPNSTLKPRVGDKYVIIDIYMPQSYVDDAEARLLAKAQESLDQNSEPNLAYTVTVDPLFIKNTGIYPDAGDYVTIKDTALDIDRSIRIVGIERNINKDNSYKLTLADTVEPSLTTQVITTLEKQDTVIQINKLKDPARARRNYKATNELVTMIETVKAEAILIGNDPAAQYSLDGALIRANYNSDANQLNITSGVAYHNYYPVGSPGTWNISELSADSLNNIAYYAYIKASKSTNTAVYVLSAVKIAVEEVSGYYHFPFGVLSSVIDGVRVFTTTKGQTLITGDCIKTGRLVSNDGLTYFDLDSGVIAGNITFINSDGQEESLASTVTGLQTQIDGQIISWFKEVNPTLSNAPANEWTTDALKQQHANDTYTNVLTGGCWRWQYSGSAWGWGVISDTATQQALVAAAAAQTTANSKRRTFTATPTVPYDIGDLWVQGSAGDIMKCKTAKAVGQSYSASDWEIASKYDKTQTIIDGGIITSGTVQLGDGTTIKAGITGYGTGETEVRLWAGNTYENRSIAPWRVLDNGNFIAINGEIAGWTLDADRIVKEEGEYKVELNSSQKKLVFSYNDVPKVTISNDELPTLASLKSPLSGTVYPGIDKTSTVNETYSLLSNSVTLVTSSDLLYTRYRYTKNPLAVTVDVSLLIRTYLTQEDGTVITSIGINTIALNNNTDSSISKSFLVPSGIYKIKYEVYFVDNSVDDGGQPAVGTFRLGGSTNSDNYINYTQERIETILAINGIASFWNSTKYLYMNPNADVFFELKGTTDIPGVIAAATVASGGGSSNQWGAKYGSSSKASTGTYTINHSIGHVNYSVQITPLTASRVGYVSAKTSTSMTIVITNLSGTATDTAFDYCIVGSN